MSGERRTNSGLVLVAFAVLAVAFGLFLLLRGGGSGTVVNPIAQAAALTEESAGGRTSFHGTTESASLSHPIAVSGEGVFNGQTRRSQATFTITTAGAEVEMEGISDGTTMYFKSDLLQPGLPAGAEWMGLDASLGSASETGLGGNSDPSHQLDVLRAASDEFEALGKQQIRGVETTGYRSTLDPDSFARYLRGRGSTKAARQYELLAEKAPSTTEIEAWIDGRKLVRRMRATVTAHDPESDEAISTRMTVNLYDFGISPEIQLPDPDTVYDVTAQARRKLGLNG